MAFTKCDLPFYAVNITIDVTNFGQTSILLKKNNCKNLNKILHISVDLEKHMKGKLHFGNAYDY